MRMIKRAVGFIAAMVLILSAAGCLAENEPDEYVKAVLDLRMQGNADELVKMVKDKNRTELLGEHNDGILAFTEVYITGGMDMSESMNAQYAELCKEIFLAMRYSVKGYEEQSKGQYEVTVEITTADVFETYLPKLALESERLLTKAQNGEYEGSKEQINDQLQQEFTYSAYDLLEESYLNMEYKEKRTVTIPVTEKEKGEYRISEDDIWSFVVKLLLLDAIQG